MIPEYQYLPSFVSSARDALQTMASTLCVHQTPKSREGSGSWGDLSGIIPIECDEFSGVVVLSFESDCAISLASRMLGEDFDEVSEEVIDAVNELTNIVSGGVKRDLNKAGYSFDLAVPRVCVGKGVEIPELAQGYITLPFKTDVGGFVVEAKFNTKEEA